MPLDGFRSRPLEFDAELAEEFRVPLVLVRFEEAVGLFVGEEVEDEGADGRVVADAVEEDPGVRGRGDGVGALGEAGDGGEDVVAELRCEQAVGEGVQVQQEEVFGAALGVAQVAIGADVVPCQLWEGLH